MRLARASILTAVLAATVLLYVREGLPEAYLVADDFSWLIGGDIFKWSRLLEVYAGDRFYRPMVDVWFGGLVGMCHQSTPCLHYANLTIHLINLSLVFWLTTLLAGGLRAPFLAALLFALVPGHTQAIVWVSAISSLLATMFYLLSLVTQVRSWTISSARARNAMDLLAIAFFVLGLCSHEAVVTLPVVSAILWWQWKPRELRRRTVLTAGFSLVFVAFLASTFFANRRNTLFTQSEYTVTLHALRKWFDYLVTLYVGPSWWLAYAFCLTGMALLCAAGPVTRFGALWLAISLVPYCFFEGGNISRYLYLPSTAYALAVGTGLTGLANLAGRSSASRQRVGHVVYALIAVFVAVRFGQFYMKSIRSQVEWTLAWRPYVERLEGTTRRESNGLRVVSSRDPDGNELYVEPIVRWLHRDHSVPVVVER